MVHWNRHLAYETAGLGAVVTPPSPTLPEQNFRAKPLSFSEGKHLPPFVKSLQYTVHHKCSYYGTSWNSKRANKTLEPGRKNPTLTRKIHLSLFVLSSIGRKGHETTIKPLIIAIKLNIFLRASELQAFFIGLIYDCRLDNLNSQLPLVERNAFNVKRPKRPRGFPFIFHFLSFRLPSTNTSQDS